MLQLRVIGPTHDSPGPEIHRVGQASRLHVTQHEAAICRQIIRRGSLSLFEGRPSYREIAAVKSTLPLSEQAIKARHLRLGRRSAAP